MPPAPCRQCKGPPAGPRNGRRRAAVRQAPAERVWVGAAGGGGCWRGGRRLAGPGAGGQLAAAAIHGCQSCQADSVPNSGVHASRVAHEPELLPGGLLATQLSSQGGPHGGGHRAVPEVVAAVGLFFSCFLQSVHHTLMCRHASSQVGELRVWWREAWKWRPSGAAAPHHQSSLFQRAAAATKQQAASHR